MTRVLDWKSLLAAQKYPYAHEQHGRTILDRKICKKFAERNTGLSQVCMFLEHPMTINGFIASPFGVLPP